MTDNTQPLWTPGQWSVGEQNEKWYMDFSTHVLDVNGMDIADCGSRAGSPTRSQLERRANARLITAAPDLYQALKNLFREADTAVCLATNRCFCLTCGCTVNLAEVYCQNEECFRFIARAALRKAEGSCR